MAKTLIDAGHAAMAAGRTKEAAQYYLQAHRQSGTYDTLRFYAYAQQDHGREEIIQEARAFIDNPATEPKSRCLALQTVLPYVESLERVRRGMDVWTAAT